MERQLEHTGITFHPIIVDTVLRKCFKFPHLGLRFFNWLKLRPEFSPTTQTYNVIFSLAAHAKNFNLLDNFIHEMENNNSCTKDIRTWTCLISLYGKANMIGKALLVFDNMLKSGCQPDQGLYRAMIRCLCQTDKGDIALEFYNEMMLNQHMNLNVTLYKMLINAISKSGDVVAVHSVADDMLRVCEVPEHDVYGSMLKSFCISGRIIEALELIRDLKKKQVALEPEYFETLVKGLCKNGRISDALEIVDIMDRRNLVDANIYGIIINGYLKRNKLSKALDTFQRMKEAGYLPSASTYTEIIQRLLKSNEYRRACGLYDEMLERGVKPDTVAITAMVAGHVSQKNIPEAWKVFQSMEDHGIKPTWKSYSVFVKELCKISRTDEVFNVLDAMQASEVEIGDEMLRWVLSCVEKKGETENIKKVQQLKNARELRLNGGGHDTVLNHIEQEQGKMNIHSVGPSVEDYNEQEQRRVDNHLSAPAPRAYDKKERRRTGYHVTAPMSKAFDEGGQVEKVNHSVNEKDLQTICQILFSPTEWCSKQEALEKCTLHFTPELVAEVLRNSSSHGNIALNFFAWVGKQVNYRHTSETYNMAIKVSGQGKDFKHMRSLFYEMRRKGYSITPDTWAIMILQHGRIGLTEIALNIFEEMKAKGCTPSGSTYKYLIISFCGKKGRKVNEAIEKFREMIRAGHVPDKELVEIYLSCLCEDGNLEAARKCLDSLCKVGYTTPLSYSMYIRSLFRAGRLDEAFEQMDEIAEDKRATLDQYIYGSLVHALLQKGRLEEALAKIDSMKKAGVNPSVHVYTSLIVHFFKEKKTDQALEIFQKMGQDGLQPTVVTYSALIRGYMNTEKFDDAWQVFNQMKKDGPLPDFKTYSMFIDCLCKVGKSDEALKILSEMSNDGIVPSTINFRTVIFGLNREGKQELARVVLKKKLDLKNKRKFLL
ncbi:hypothetical protein ACFE04_021285 [Oxalis oulophora]